MTSPKPPDSSPDPTPGSPRSAELIAKDLAFEAMKWLIRYNGDANRLSALGLAALDWAGVDTDDRDAYLTRTAEADRRTAPSTEFVRNTDSRVWATKPILRSRGWTEAAMRDHLPEPEGFKPNPRFSDSGHPMPVWLPETVAEAEATPEWQRWLQKSLHRRGTTMHDLAQTDDADFLHRIRAVQDAIDAYLSVQIARREADAARKEVAAG